VKGKTVSKDNYRVWWTHPESDSQGFDYFQVGDRWNISDPDQMPGDFEQSTGRMDGNKKEIYIGDLVDCKIVTDALEGQKSIICLVEWNDHDVCFYLNDFKNRQLYRFVGGTSNTKVVGNIHEDAELTKTLIN